MSGIKSVWHNMTEHKRLILKRLSIDVLKVMFLTILLGWGLYQFDNTNIAVIQAFAISLFLVGGTHLTRRILFHKLDLQAIALKAVNEENFPAAVVFCAIIYFLVKVFEVSLMVMK